MWKFPLSLQFFVLPYPNNSRYLSKISGRKKNKNSSGILHRIPTVWHRMMQLVDCQKSHVISAFFMFADMLNLCIACLRIFFVPLMLAYNLRKGLLEIWTKRSLKLKASISGMKKIHRQVMHKLSMSTNMKKSEMTWLFWQSTNCIIRCQTVLSPQAAPPLDFVSSLRGQGQIFSVLSIALEVLALGNRSWVKALLK